MTTMYSPLRSPFKTPLSNPLESGEGNAPIPNEGPTFDSNLVTFDSNVNTFDEA